ncbi:MAG TPA: sugar phosphate nucleotidyltransferase, partial [Pyrinomonadaceae bacterium]|nr:sugar phosphate nucleotidyltransferase [Pyrinomonadaceae bacterium]
MKYSTDAEQDRPDAWAILLAGGDGTRLQSLTCKITGDLRPKQFCRLFGDRSLLGHTRKRLRPIFSDDRTVFVVTKDHETFYMKELADAKASRVLTQPANRGTGVAIIVALLRILQYDADAVVAVFPSDHYFADEAAFAATVRSSLVAAGKYTESVILIGAEPQWPAVDFGWIEPAGLFASSSHAPLLRVSGFWEKPPLATARELMKRGGLWNTFVTVGHASAFLDLLRSTIPDAMARIADALARDDLDDAFLDLDTIDFSMAVLSREPHRLLVIPDAASGWTDLGNPDRVIETLIQSENKPRWLREMCGSGDPTLGTSAPTPLHQGLKELS